MDKPMDRGEKSPGLLDRLGDMERRQFLTKAAAAGAVAWATPMILSRPAYAVEGGAGSPSCRPPIAVQVTNHNCPRVGNTQQLFPAVQITVGQCGCAPQNPQVCARIDPGLGLVPFQVPPPVLLIPPLVVYGDATDCHANGVTEILNTTAAGNCITPAKTIFFGNPRPGGTGQIQAPALTTISFRLSVWAGGCPDGSSPDPAYNCQTYGITIVWLGAAGVDLNASVVTSAVPTLCTSGATPPCTCP